MVIQIWKKKKRKKEKRKRIPYILQILMQNMKQINKVYITKIKITHNIYDQGVEKPFTTQNSWNYNWSS